MSCCMQGLVVNEDKLAHEPRLSNQWDVAFLIFSNMTRWLIKTRFARLSDAVFETTCGAILLLMSGNPSYTTPNPTLIALGTLLTAYHDALVAWGPEGNRGSHAQHIAVLDTRFALEVGMVSLSDYCMTTTPYDRTAFVS